MNKQQASYHIQAPNSYRVGEPHPSSLPLEPGTRVRVGRLSDTFEVLDFDGSMCRNKVRASLSTSDSIKSPAKAGLYWAIAIRGQHSLIKSNHERRHLGRYA